MVKNLPTVQETQETCVHFLGQEDSLEELATHSNILAWEIPWTEEPGRLQSIGWQRVRHNWVTITFNYNFNYYKSTISFRNNIQHSVHRVFSKWFAFGFKSLGFFFSFCISQIFISKLFQNNHENISNSNKKKKSYTFWSLILSGCSLCIISCYDIHGKHLYFYKEWRRIHEVLLLAPRTLSSWTNNWTLLWGVQS